jgi:DnaA-homolog protein
MEAQLLDLFSTTATFDNFIPMQNVAIYNSLKVFSNQFTHLTGGKLSGKTHLLQAWVRLAQQNGKNAIYIESLFDDSVNFRDIKLKFDYIAIDNIERLNGLQQILLFDLFNAIKLENLKVSLLTSSSKNLDKVTTIRDDLKTRLMSGLNLNLKSLNDDEIKEALIIYIEYQGITLNDAEMKFLITHCQRNIGVLISNIHSIAEAAVLQNRNITIPFIKTILKL